MNVAITTLANNLNMSFENIVLLLFVLAGFIFYVQDVKIGMILHVLMTGVLFILFYINNLSYVYSLITMFMFIVITSLTLMPVTKGESAGGFI